MSDRPRSRLRGALAALRQATFKISTPPYYESYSWGPKQSIVAKIIYWSFFIARLASPLQWFKWRTRSNTSNEVINQRGDRERSDFHARSTEQYLLTVLCVSIVSSIFAKYFHYSSPYIRYTLYLLLFESVCWTFYYLAFRPLIERRLDIYDEAEYFILLPVVFLTETLIVYSLYFSKVAFTDVLSMFFNGPVRAQDPVSDTVRVCLFVLGQTYIIVIIANLIRVVPAIPVRRRVNL